MFSFCSSLTSLDVTSFDTSNVTDMTSMFINCLSLTSLDVTSFNTSNVTNMNGMFYNCSSLTSLNVSSFNTSNVTDNMSYMFYGCPKLTSLNVSSFNTSKVTGMGFMFYGCSALTSLDLSNFDTSIVEDMHWMFANCSSLTSLNVSNFDTSKITDMEGMFSQCYDLTSLDLSSFDMSAVTRTTNILYRCSALTTIQTPKAIGSTAVDLPTPKTNYSWFDQANTNNAYTQITSACTNKTLVLHENYSYLRTDWQTALINKNANFKQANIKTIQFVKSVPSGSGYTQVSVGAITSAGTTAYVSGTAGASDITAYIKANSSDSTKYDIIFYSPVTIYAPIDSSYLFSNSTTANRLTNLTSISFTNFNTSKVTTVQRMFYYCSALTTLNLSNFNTSNVTNMHQTFYYCSELTGITLGNNFKTSNVTTMRCLFGYCSKLSSIDVSSFDTSKVTDMGYMFQACSTLKSIIVSNFVTTNVVDFQGMFSGCTSLTTLDVSNFNTSSATKMQYMFSDCSGLTTLSLGTFDMSKVTNTSNMLSDCSALTRISTPRTMGSAAIALPDNGKWINNANNNGPYSEITGAGMNSITLVIARNLILNYEEAVNCETRSAVLSGVTVTNNFDGSFTLNGTQTATISLASVKVKLNKGDHWGCYYTYISGSYTRTSGSLVAVDLKKENQDSLTTRTYISYGDPGTTNRWIGDETVDQATSDETGTVYFWIWYNPGTSAGATEGGFTFNNLRIKLTFFRYYEAQTSSTLYCCKDAGLPKTVPVPTMEGKDFDGYYGIVDGAGIKYYDKDGKLLVTNFPDQANIRLYPKWTTKKHTTTINPNGGKYNNSTSNTTKTLEENQACDILTSQKDGYYNSSYSDTASRTYEAIYAKNAGVSFNGTASSFGVIPRTYMYTDKILISFEAYSANWSNLNSQVMLSCTQSGGWSFGHSSGNVSFIVYDSGRNSYMPATSNISWDSLSAGWHEFTGSFDGQYARLYVDGQLCGMSYLFKGSIKYHASNSIIVGGEAGSASSPDDSYFNGKIRNVIIANDYCDANTISTTAPTNNTGTPYITVGSTADKTVTAQWQQDVVVDLDNCVTKPYTNLQLTSNTNGAWATNKTSDGNYEYVFTFNSYKNASIGAGPHIQGLYSYMTHGQRYRITITAKSSKTFSVPMRFEAAAPDASKTINLTTSYQTFYLDFTYDSTAQYHSFTFYSKNYTAGQTITFKDIRISKLLAPSSTYGTLPTLTKTGYTFDGWWTAASNGIKVAENTTLTSNSRHTLYPRWIINESYLLQDWKTALTRKNSNFTPGNIKTISFTNTAPTGSGYTQVSVGATTKAGTIALTPEENIAIDIIAYVKANSSNSSKYDVIFYSPVTIYAPIDSSLLFSDSTSSKKLTNLTSVSFDNFNTNNTTDMSNMFIDCSKLTSLDLSSFDTSNVTNMALMFASCTKLTSLDVSSFDTSKVTTMEYMFACCEKLTSLTLTNFNTSNVTNMDNMFQGNLVLTSLDVSSFDTSKVTNMQLMFAYNNKLTTLNISSFNMSNVTNTTDMLNDCTALTTIQTPKAIGSTAVDLPTAPTNYGWFKQGTTSTYTQITSSCINTTLVLDGNIYKITFNKNGGSGGTNELWFRFNGDKFYTNATCTTELSNQKITCPTRTGYSFDWYTEDSGMHVSFEKDGTYSAEGDQDEVFIYAKNFTFTASWTLNKSYLRRDWKDVISDSYTLATIKFTKTRPTGSGYKTLSVGASNPAGTINYTSSTYGVTDIIVYLRANSRDSSNYDAIFYSPVTIYAPINSSNLFRRNYDAIVASDDDTVDISRSGCHLHLTSINFDNFDTSNVTSMNYMFAENNYFTSISLSSFNTSNVLEMGGMFAECSLLTSIDLSNFVTSKVTNMSSMFSECVKITFINLSSFVTNNVIDMDYMFYKCSALTSLSISNFNMSSVTSTSYMIYACTSLTTIYTPKSIKSGTSIALPSKTDYSWYKSTDTNRNTRITSITSSYTSCTLQLKKTMYTITITGSSGSNGSFNVNGAESGTIRLEAGTQFTISMHCWGYAFNSAYIDWSISGNATIDSWNKWGDVNSATCDTTNKSGRLLCKSTVSMKAYMEVKVTIHGNLTITRSGGKK